MTVLQESGEPEADDFDKDVATVASQHLMYTISRSQDMPEEDRTMRMKICLAGGCVSALEALAPLASY